jgi:hypothetical protein
MALTADAQVLRLLLARRSQTGSNLAFGRLEYAQGRQGMRTRTDARSASRRVMRWN